MPACGDRPEAIENAMASGNATRPTVMPARMSAPACCRSYERSDSRSRGEKTDCIDIAILLCIQSCSVLWLSGHDFDSFQNILAEKQGVTARPHSGKPLSNRGLY